MVLSGAALLLLGVFVGRPYCRFLCPYGALLKLGAIVAKWRVRVTPDYCTQCRLCEASCPFGAMREPEASPAGTPGSEPKTGGAWPGCWRSCRCCWSAAAGWARNSARLPRGSTRPSAWPSSSCAREGTAAQARRADARRPGARTRAAEPERTPDRGRRHPAQVRHRRLDFRRLGRAGHRREARSACPFAAAGPITSRTAGTVSPAPAASSTAPTSWSGAA